MSKHITWTEYAEQFDNLISATDHSPGECDKDCDVCKLENSLEVLLHNDQPPTCPHCGSRMRELDDRIGLHACNNESCDYVCRFENDEDMESVCYYVDVPNPHVASNSDDANAWINIGTFNTKKEATDFLRLKYGISPDLAEVFLTEGQGQ